LELGLRWEAAGALLLLHESPKAEAHLKVLRPAWARVYLLEGDIALREGRVELARLALERAVRSAELKKDLNANVMLASAQMALGNLAGALEALVNVEAYLARNEQLKEEEERTLNKYLNSRKAVYLHMVRCYLSLANKATSPEERQLLLKAADA